MPQLQPMHGVDVASGHGQSWTSDTSTMAAPLLMLLHSPQRPQGCRKLPGSSEARGAEGTGDPPPGAGLQDGAGGAAVGDLLQRFPIPGSADRFDQLWRWGGTRVALSCPTELSPHPSHSPGGSRLGTHVLLVGKASVLQLGEDQLPVDLNLKGTL